MGIALTGRVGREAEIADMLGLSDANVCLVGSTLIKGEGKDEDFLVLTSDTELLEEKGFAPDLGEDGYPSEFQSFRKGGVNIIACVDRGYYLAEVAIAEAARALFYHARNDGQPAFDMETREGRVLFHGIVREAVQVRLHAVQPMTKAIDP